MCPDESEGHEASGARSMPSERHVFLTKKQSPCSDTVSACLPPHDLEKDEKKEKKSLLLVSVV